MFTPEDKRRVGEVIQEAIRAAKEYKERPTEENQRKYDPLFAEIYKYFYPKVYGMVKAKIKPPGTEEDVQELCNDIFMKIRENLHNFK